jgi:hypothetical protein
MKKTNLMIKSLLLFLFASTSAFAIETQLYINGEPAKDPQYVFVGNTVKVVSTSKNPRSYWVSGSIGDKSSTKKHFDSVTLEHVVTKQDLKNKELLITVFFSPKEETNLNPTVESFITKIPVTTQKALEKRAKKLANETDEQALKRVMKEMGFSRSQCKELMDM